MDDPFLRALQSVKLSDPKNHVAAIRALFTVINSLDAPGIMTAFQTYDFFRENIASQADEAIERSIEKVENAMIIRMLFLCAQAQADSRKALAITFLQATGDPTMYHLRFRMAGYIGR